jgi:DNA repair photolyase
MTWASDMEREANWLRKISNGEVRGCDLEAMCSINPYHGCSHRHICDAYKGATERKARNPGLSSLLDGLTEG